MKEEIVRLLIFNGNLITLEKLVFSVLIIPPNRISLLKFYNNPGKKGTKLNFDETLTNKALEGRALK